MAFPDSVFHESSGLFIHPFSLVNRRTSVNTVILADVCKVSGRFAGCAGLNDAVRRPEAKLL